MIVYLLVPVLVLGVVDSQGVNTTDTETEETNEVEPRHTTSVSTLETITMKPSDVTSGLFEDVKSQVEDELKSNLTSAYREDNEDFQEQEDKLLPQHCQQDNMILFSQMLCVEPFHSRMEGLKPGNWCNIEMIIGSYNDMTMCMEDVAHIFHCFYPNYAIQGLFLNVHTSFFQNCTKEEVVLQDAPQWLVVLLTLIPVSLIPVLTYMVVWKSKVQE